MEHFIVLFLLIASAAIRLGFLNAGLFHHDSFQLAVAVEKTVNEGNLYGIGGGRHGSVIVNSFFFYLFKMLFNQASAEFTVNFTSALFGALSVPLLYVLVKRLTNDNFISFSSSILYSVNPIFLSVSTFAKEYTLDAFTTLLSILLFVVGLKKMKYYWFFISGLFLSFLIFIRSPSILASLSTLYLAFNFKMTNKAEDGSKKFSIMRAIVIYLMPFISILIIYLALSSGTVANEARSNFNTLMLEGIAFIFKNSFRYSFEGLIYALTLAGFLLCLIGFVLLYKKQRKLFYFAILFFIPLFIFYASSKTVSHRFFSLAIAPLTIALSFALYQIRKKDLFLGNAILLALIVTFFMNIHPVIKQRHEFSAFKELASMINANTNPQDSIVVLYGDDTPAINYYSKTPTLGCSYAPDITSIQKFIHEIEEALDKNLKIFISGACFGLGTFEERRLFLDMMNDNFKGSIVTEYISDDYHRGDIKPIIKKISMIRLYNKNSPKGNEMMKLDVKY